MELTKEAVKHCRCVGALRDFLCQAMDQIDEKDKEIAELKAKIEDIQRTKKIITTKSANNAHVLKKFVANAQRNSNNG